MSPPRLLIAACLALSALTSDWLSYLRYWKWRDCIREPHAGCITPGGMLWGLFALVLAAAALRIALRR